MPFRDSRQVRVAEVGQVTATNRTRAVLILSVPVLSLVLPALAVALASAGGTSLPTRIAAAIAKFLLFYSGVFALIALSGAVAAGLLATDRMVMSPDNRILAQALHRTMSLIGISALANHIMLEVLAQRARIIDGIVPFMAARDTFYMGLGTIASDLFIIIIVTGIARRRFSSGARRWVWRSLHATAYAAWPLAVLHGLLAGRSAKPYVDWSYGGCLAAVGLVLTIRYIVAIRGRNAATGQPGRGRVAASSWPGLPPRPAGEFLAQLEAARPRPAARPPLQTGNRPLRELPAAPGRSWYPVDQDEADTDPTGWNAGVQEHAWSPSARPAGWSR
jgi:hypothetical protein